MVVGNAVGASDEVALPMLADDRVGKAEVVLVHEEEKVAAATRVVALAVAVLEGVCVARAEALPVREEEKVVVDETVALPLTVGELATTETRRTKPSVLARLQYPAVGDQDGANGRLIFIKELPPPPPQPSFQPPPPPP